MASVPEATPQARLLRYDNGAVILHWLTALIVVTQVVVGFVFASMERGPAQGQVFTLHKTLGALILVLALVRLGWRIAHPPPPFPPELPRWERVPALLTHWAFYALLILLPLTGLTAISGHANGAASTPLLGGIPLPLIPGISEDLGEQAGDVHVLLVFVTLALLVLHVAAALKHQIRGNRAAGRMPPFRASGEEATPVRR